MSIAFSDLERSTAMFGRLADSNAMAQIMYGLALRSVSVSGPFSLGTPSDGSPFQVEC